MEYQYPLDMDWSTEDIVHVIAFYEAVEKVYEKGIARTDFMDKYRRFKQIVPSIAEEKRIGKNFEDVSGYSIYRAVQAAKKAAEDRVKL
ncbi:MAG: UPF0223 family protein [Bacillus sp. (in: firmicutes)]